MHSAASESRTLSISSTFFKPFMSAEKKIAFIHLVRLWSLGQASSCRYKVCDHLLTFCLQKRIAYFSLTISWRRPLSYRNQSIDFRSKSMDWFLYDNGLRHERVNTSLLMMTGAIKSSSATLLYPSRVFIVNFKQTPDSAMVYLWLT